MLREAFWVNQQLVEADRRSLPMPEDAITTFVLMHLATCLPPSVFNVRSFSRGEEALNGADWEWWFGDGPGSPYVGMRVQAKKLKVRKNGAHYYDFNHKIGKSGKLQINALRNEAKASGLPAIYVLYNGSFQVSEFDWHCDGFTASEDVFGVSLISADAADKLRTGGTTTLRDVGSLSLPWSCMMLCPKWLAGGPPPTPFGEGPGPIFTFAADFLAALRRKGEFPAARGMPSGTIGWDFVPSYVRALSTEGRAEWSDDVAARGLGGVLVFSP